MKIILFPVFQPAHGLIIVLLPISVACFAFFYASLDKYYSDFTLFNVIKTL